MLPSINRNAYLDAAGMRVSNSPPESRHVLLQRFLSHHKVKCIKNELYFAPPTPTSSTRNPSLPYRFLTPASSIPKALHLKVASRPSRKMSSSGYKNTFFKEHYVLYIYNIIQPSFYQLDCITGGPNESRTHDLMLAKHVLSQLSYGPLRVSLFMVKGVKPHLANELISC